MKRLVLVLLILILVALVFWGRQQDSQSRTVMEKWQQDHAACTGAPDYQTCMDSRK